MLSIANKKRRQELTETMGERATYYDILRVGPKAAPASVRTAYRQLAQRCHPDKLPGNADAVRVMIMLNEAYDVLSDPDRRASYDRRIASNYSCARTARLARIAAIEAPQAAWPWYLVFATIAFAAATVATVVYKTVVPGVAQAVAAPASQPALGGQPAHSVVSRAPAAN